MFSDVSRIIPSKRSDVLLPYDAAHLCGFDDGIDASGALSAGIGATEEIILATENRRSHAALGGVVAHFQPTVRQVAQQRVPSCESIGNGPGECALAADRFQGSLEKPLQLDQSRSGILGALRLGGDAKGTASG